MSLEPGSIIDNYTILEKIGVGGTGTVYRARETSGEHRLVALKVLAASLVTDAAQRQYLSREVALSASLQHEHILPVYTFGAHEGTPYLTMKLVEGGNLSALLSEGNLPYLLIARVMGQIASALDFAHNQHILHRDVKPSNILFDTKGHTYLADFGIARLNTPAETPTMRDSFIGSAPYASPEQIRGEELTSASDIYSLGVVLFEMLTGQRIFQGASGLAVIHQHLNAPIPDPREHRPDAPESLHWIIQRALAKKPENRYASARELASDVNRSLQPLLHTRRLNLPDEGAAEAPPPEPAIQSFSPTRPTPPATPARLKQLAYVMPDIDPDAPTLDPVFSREPLVIDPPPKPQSSAPQWSQTQLIVIGALAVAALIVLAVLFLV